MLIIKCEPHKEPIITTIDGSLESMQEVVDGYIETICRKGVALVLNEEGKLRGLEANRMLITRYEFEDYDEELELDLIVGTFFICGIEGDELASLTLEKAEQIARKLKVSDDKICLEDLE